MLLKSHKILSQNKNSLCLLSDEETVTQPSEGLTVYTKVACGNSGLVAQVQSSYCGRTAPRFPRCPPLSLTLLTHPTSPRLVKLVFGGRRALRAGPAASADAWHQHLPGDSAVTSLDIPPVSIGWPPIHLLYSRLR